MLQTQRFDVIADKQNGKLGNGYSLVYGFGALWVDKAFDLKALSSELWGTQQNNTWDKNSNWGEKHEISVHLLRCLRPRELVLNGI